MIPSNATVDIDVTTTVNSTAASISDTGSISDILAEYYGLQYAMYTCLIFQLVGALFYFLTAIYIPRDKKDTELFAAGKPISK